MGAVAPSLHRERLLADLDAATPVDLHGMAREAGVDLDAAFVSLAALYEDIDARNGTLTQHLDLPCHGGCSMCCHESLFLTPLELFYVWQERADLSFGA